MLEVSGNAAVALMLCTTACVRWRAERPWWSERAAAQAAHAAVQADVAGPPTLQEDVQAQVQYTPVAGTMAGGMSGTTPETPGAPPGRRPLR